MSAVTQIINTVLGIKGIAATVAITSLVVGGPAYLIGRHDGKAANEKHWLKGVDKVEGRVEDGEEELAAVPDKAPAIALESAKQKIELGKRSQRNMGRLEGQILALRLEMENAKPDENKCGSMPLPDDVRLRHEKLDRILEGASRARRAGEN